MNRTQTLAIAVLATLLPFAQAAFASDREREDRDYERPEHARGHGHHGHHNRHHNCHDDHRYRHYQSHYDRGHRESHYDRGHNVNVTLPFPPLPPFPVIILNKKHHGGHIELRRQY